MLRRLSLLVLLLCAAAPAHASDFASLGVALLALFLAAVNVLLGIRALFVANDKGVRESLGYLFGSAFLAFIAVLMIMEESRHMSDSDVKGLVIAVCAPVVLFAVVSAIVGRSKKGVVNEDSTEA